MDTGRGDEFELMRGVGSKDSGEEGIRAIEESVNPAVWNSKPSQMDERCKLVPNSASGDQCVITRICQFEGGMHVDEVIDPIQTCFLCDGFVVG
jgi:hypothetical protein